MTRKQKFDRTAVVGCWLLAVVAIEGEVGRVDDREEDCAELEDKGGWMTDKKSEPSLRKGK